MHTRPGRAGKPAKRCEACAQKYAAVQKQRRLALRLEGLARGVCINCGADRDRPEVQLCDHCRQVSSQNSVAYQRRRSLPRRRRKARKRAKLQHATRARETARQLADTLLRQLRDGMPPRLPVQ
jgi:hypothetical protein